MSASILIDRFTRLKQSVSGRFSPGEFSRLAEMLASEEGEISYSLSGNLVSDAAGSQKRSVKCIIYGWFFLTDPLTLQPQRHELEIQSRLVLVTDESELPPLELEAEDEDYIVCGNEMNVRDRVEEEVLLNLPAAYASGRVAADSAASPGKTPKGKPRLAEPQTGPKISPFARLAELKKK